MSTVICLVSALLCMIGAVAVIKWCALKIASDSDGGKRVYLVLLKGECADIELQMAAETLEWDTALAKAAAYAVDCGLSKGQREICEEICRGCRFVIVTPEQLTSLLG